ncbi:MAG: hypothetical protein QM775_00390 [Pirellulales bacterium]
MLQFVFAACLCFAPPAPAESVSLDRAAATAKNFDRLQEFQHGRKLLDLVAQESDDQTERLKPFIGSVATFLARWPGESGEVDFEGEQKTRLHFVNVRGRPVKHAPSGAVWADYLITGKVLKVDADSRTILLEVDDKSFEFLQSG